MKKHGRILVIEEDGQRRTELCALLRDEGYVVDGAADGFKALPKLAEHDPELVLTDLHVPGMDRLRLMTHVHEHDPECAVIVMAHGGTVTEAVAAMKAGAVDYLTKPLHMTEALVVIERALERRRLRLLQGQVRRQATAQRRIENIVGDSPAMRAVVDTILRVAPSRASVLICGESGTGKELVASAIHEHSPRAAGPLVKLHCAALAETLLESELFGHERGAFTGATQRRIGLLEQADRGTLFLDEISEISPAIQVKLLRFLQDHEIQRVGGSQVIKLDVRVIAATNRDLRQAAAEGSFREDLYYRLDVACIELPPLRERTGDIPLIAAQHLRRLAREEGDRVRGFTEEAMACMTRYGWPGNVRELANAIERAVIISRGELITVEDLPDWVRGPGTQTTPRDGLPPIPGATMDELERYAIIKTLEHTGGSTAKAAELLRVSVRTIQYRLQAYQLSKRRGRRSAGEGAAALDPPSGRSADGRT